jgi:REP element-mobilizing transposase RayT
MSVRMARKPRVEFEGAFYHVIVRGNQRQKIFATIGTGLPISNASNTTASGTDLGFMRLC